MVSRSVLHRHGSAASAPTSPVLGNTPYQVLFAATGVDPIGKTHPDRQRRFEVIGVFDKRPSAGRLQPGAGRLRGHPDHRLSARLRDRRGVNVRQGTASGAILPIQIACVPRQRRLARRTRWPTIEQVMRIRHGLQPRRAERLRHPHAGRRARSSGIRSARATFLALVVISSIALMVGGIGVMAIMIDLGHRTHARDRRAQGARARGAREILLQFLIGSGRADLRRRRSRHSVIGAGIGLRGPLDLGLPHLAALVVVRHRPRLLRVGRHLLRHGPGGQGASRLDPIEALRYE